MWFFLTLLIGVGLLHSVNHLSMIPEWRWRLLWLAVLMVLLWAMYPKALTFNLGRLRETVAKPAVLTDMCVLATLEAIAGLVASIGMVGWYERRLHRQAGMDEAEEGLLSWRTRVAQAAGMMLGTSPSAVGLVGLIWGMFVVLDRVQEISFALASLCYALAVVVILAAAIGSWHWLLPGWRVRVEVKLVLAIVQLLLAMFLPLLVAGTDVGHQAAKADGVMTAVVLGVLVAGMMLGWIRFEWQRRHSRQGNWRLL